MKNILIFSKIVILTFCCRNFKIIVIVLNMHIQHYDV